MARINLPTNPAPPARLIAPSPTINVPTPQPRVTEPTPTYRPPPTETPYHINVGRDQNNNDVVPPPPSGARPPATPPTGQPSGRVPTYTEVAAAYQKYLGRAMGANEYQMWATRPDWEQGISGSQEAKNFQAAHPGGNNITSSTGPYANIQGFDYGKLSGATPYDSAEKYSDAVRVFSQGLGSGVQLGRNNLQSMVDYAKSRGFGNAQAVGDDKIDFGDGRGAIDVIQSNGSVWFQNGADRLGGGGGGAGGAGGSGAGGAGGNAGYDMTGGAGSSQTQYGDQSTNLLLNTIMQRMEQLQHPVKDPMSDLYQLYGLGRVGGLEGAPFTNADDAALLAKYREPLTQARDAAHQQTAERMGARGIGPTSGLYQGEQGKVDQAYVKGVAGISNDLGVRAIDERQKRQDRQLQVLSDLVNAGRNTRNEQTARSQELLSTAAMPMQIDQDRLKLLLSASGDGSGSSALMNNLMQLQSLNNSQSRYNDQQSADQAKMWGDWIAQIVAGYK